MTIMKTERYRTLPNATEFSQEKDKDKEKDKEKANDKDKDKDKERGVGAAKISAPENRVL